jgi:hypothetical protein
MILQADGGDKGCDNGEERRGVDRARGNAVVRVRVVRRVRAERLENMLKIVGDEIEAHEEEEDGHGEACEHFGAFESAYRTLV